MGQIRHQPPRWVHWAALLSGMATGYGLLLSLYLGFR